MIGETIASQALMTALKWVYDQVVAPKLKGNAVAIPGSDEHMTSIIRWTAAQAGAVGFTSNIGGVLTLPIALPANIAGVSALQIHMVQEIARARGHDLSSDEVKILTIACLGGGAVVDVLKSFGINASVRVAQRAVTQLSAQTLARISQVIGAKLVARAGGQGLANLARFVPLVGGVVGGSVDAAATFAIAEAAKRVFPRIDLPVLTEPLALEAPVA